MAVHNDLGQSGERAAELYLRQKGYDVTHRNWRFGHKEIDIVARKGNLLVFVEVKTRRNDMYGLPSEAVDARKIRRLISSANAFIQKYAIDSPVRFDIITVIMDGCSERIEHIEDAFLPSMF